MIELILFDIGQFQKNGIEKWVILAEICMIFDTVFQLLCLFRHTSRRDERELCDILVHPINFMYPLNRFLIFVTIPRETKKLAGGWQLGSFVSKYYPPI